MAVNAAWSVATTCAPSPTAAATRLIEPDRTSPIAKMPLRLVSTACTRHRFHQTHVEAKREMHQVLRPLLALTQVARGESDQRKQSEREQQPADAEGCEGDARARRREASARAAAGRDRGRSGG